MEHTSKQFEFELEDLRSGLLAMGGLVEAQLERALEAIASGEDELVEVVVREEKRVNEAQIELDRKSMEVIAKRQPAAVDLRQIVCTMQAVNDLERIGEAIGFRLLLRRTFLLVSRLLLRQVARLASFACRVRILGPIERGKVFDNLRRLLRRHVEPRHP